MKLNLVFIFTIFVLFAFSVKITIATQIVVEFYYWDPSKEEGMCWTCPGWLSAYYDFLNKSEIFSQIKREYEGFVTAEEIEWNAYAGKPKNSIVINGEHIFFGDFTVDDVRAYIDACLRGECPAESSEDNFPLAFIILSSYTFGFFETFSPCLIALLSFILSYTIVEGTSVRRKIMQIASFSFGFAAAAVAIFLVMVFGIVALSVIFNVQEILMWIVSIFAIIFGLNLMGLTFHKGKRDQTELTKPLVVNLARKYVISYFGLVLLGFTFYFLDPCIAPVFVAMISAYPSPILFSHLPLIVSLFCLGVLTPFLIAGLFSSSISKLTRSLYRYKARVRAVSGAILIVYAAYLILTLLLFKAKVF